MRFAIALCIWAASLLAGQQPQQQPPNQPPGGAKPEGSQNIVPSGAQGNAPAGGVWTFTFSAALAQAQSYNQQFVSAVTAAGVARESRVQAKAALFPTLNALNQFIYTQGNFTPSGVFVANDGVHVYNEQATVHAELFSITKLADYRAAFAGEAAARARQEIAARGLIATVVQSYYTLLTSQRHLTNAAASVDEARRFFDITQKQEAGGEAAHADVIKAQLQLQQRERDYRDAEINVEKARIGLGVILMPDINQRFQIEDDLKPDLPLPSLEEVRSKAMANSPDVRAAEAGLRQAGYGITSARGAYYPSLVIDYFYGIDANVFAATGPDDRHNLGSVVQATVNVPVWNWGATRSKVRQAELQQKQAQFDLTVAERQLQVNIQSFYLEAQAARAQLDSLRSSLDLSDESLRLTVLRYQAGEATALEVVDAQTTLAQARNAYVDGLARYRVALAELETLTGRP
jgi:outer membrane protein TolC